MKLKDAGTCLVPLISIMPPPSILFFLRLSFLICKEAIMKVYWNVVKIMLNNIYERVNHIT